MRAHVVCVILGPGLCLCVRAHSATADAAAAAAGHPRVVPHVEVERRKERGVGEGARRVAKVLAHGDGWQWDGLP